MPTYVDEPTLSRAVQQLKGSAGPFFLNWVTLKHMGLTESSSVEIDTSNSTPHLQRLFEFGDPDNDYFIPFAHTVRYSRYKAHAARSVVQTNIRQWYEGTGTKKPTHLFDIRESGGARLRVSTSRAYPAGLGTDENGFAEADGTRVALPETAWAVWYGRRTPIPDEENAERYLVGQMIAELHISPAERVNVFVDEPCAITTSPSPITDAALNNLCSRAWQSKATHQQVSDTPELNLKRVALTKTLSARPSWMSQPPQDQLEELIIEGHGAILLTGPPRTGKTRAVRLVAAGQDAAFIQIHDGWSYAQLIVGQVLEGGTMGWRPGPLLNSLRAGTPNIILEEVNRTRISQALGEVFSLLEPAYRGEASALPLPNGEQIFIPEETVLFFTMNTIDKSTEDLDDALFGRIRAVEFPPRVEDLGDILTANGLTEINQSNKIRAFFQEVQAYYPLGHGYFADLKPDTNLGLFYMSSIRPVLANHFASFEPETLDKIDNLFDEVVIQSDE